VGLLAGRAACPLPRSPRRTSRRRSFGQGCFEPRGGQGDVRDGELRADARRASRPIRPPDGLLACRDGGGAFGVRARRAPSMVSGAAVQCFGTVPRSSLADAERDRSDRDRASTRPTASYSFPPSRASARRTGYPDARGLIAGITQRTTSAHLVRATRGDRVSGRRRRQKRFPWPCARGGPTAGAAANGFLMHVPRRTSWGCRSRLRSRTRGDRPQAQAALAGPGRGDVARSG
jgi:hypothetical protein